VISDNHLGDWGTQFGMIIYGWKHFGDRAAYEMNPVAELARVYRFVRKLMDYFEARRRLPEVTARIETIESELARSRATHPTSETKTDKKAAQLLRKLDREQEELREELAQLGRKIDEANGDASLAQSLAEHANIEEGVLAETAKLHAGDEENLRLWRDFLPACREDIQRIYQRLGVRFDHELGESFYHDQLAGIVADLERRGLARESDGATCVFLEGFETPMIVRKRDGAFLYSTTDLATIAYRMRQFQPDVILYVVDHRQSEHFQKLFAAAQQWGYGDVDLRHIGFGTVLGPDGTPVKTREGDLIGLQWLLDEAVAAAHRVVCQLDDAKESGPQLSAEERRKVAWVLGHGAIKYTDLSQNRESDYQFDLEKMVALKGATATYMEYAYARVNGIFMRGDIDVQAIRASGAPVLITHPAERALGLALLRLAETLEECVAEYRPNFLAVYLYDLAKAYSIYFDNCPVLKAETPVLRNSRLLLCDLTARVLRQGLALLGIDVVERM
jgi:arginyl-tRNA synthetase